MCSDGNGLRWVTDHTVDQLTACKGRQTTLFKSNCLMVWIFIVNSQQAILLMMEDQLLITVI